MQNLLVTMSVFIFVTAMFVQTVWMFLGKRGRDRYLRDIGNFRKPSSSWSRYYHWRVDSLRNSILDGVIFDILLLLILIVLLLMTLELYEIPDALIYVVFVMVLSAASTIQAASRIKGLKQRESTIIKQVEEANDKIAAAREIAFFLISAGPTSDGRMWFALYRVGQIQDPVGWAVRDVLLDPELKEYQEGGLTPPPKDLGSSDTDGPGIS
ncbi:MAG: hypothetical protein ACW98Y_00075 [Candidatus Thorarchaeota archaeon]|jgi:hypothetical protein